MMIGWIKKKGVAALIGVYDALNVCIFFAALLTKRWARFLAAAGAVCWCARCCFACNTHTRQLSSLRRTVRNRLIFAIDGCAAYLKFDEQLWCRVQWSDSTLWTEWTQWGVRSVQGLSEHASLVLESYLRIIYWCRLLYLQTSHLVLSPQENAIYSASWILIFFI